MYKYSDPVRHNTLFHGYKASDKSVQIGVKVFHLTRVPSSLDGFKAEKKALQRLGRLLEFDEKHGLLVYRWIDGEPLDVLLARLSSPSTIQALYQVYTGLAQRLSQETGLLHKGIRPEFVIVTRDSLNMELVSFERSVEASLDPLKRQLEVRLEESRSVNEFSLTLKHIRARRLKSLSDPLRAVLPLTVTLGHGRQYRVQEYIRKTPRGIDYIARPVSSNSLRNNEREVFIRQFDRVSDTQGFLMEAEAMFHMGYVVSHFEDSVFVGVLPRGERLVNLIDDAPVEQVRVWTLEALSLVERTMAEYGLLHLSIGPECLFYDSSTKQLQLWEFWMSVRVLKGDPQWESKRAFAEGLVQQEFSPWLQEIRPVPEYKQEHLQGNKHRFLSASQDAALRNKLSYRVASLHRPLSETQTPITDS